MFQEINKILNLESDASLYREVLVNADQSVLFLKIDTDNRVVDSGSDKKMVLSNSDIRAIDDFFSPKSSDVGTYFEPLKEDLLLEVNSGTLTINSLNINKKVSTIRRYSKEQWDKIVILSM